MGILVTLLGISTINLSGFQSKSTLNNAVGVFIADLKSQQLRSMTGQDRDASFAQAHGVHFESDSYTLFRGETYSPVNPNNFRVNLPRNTQFIPVNTDIVFAVGSGEISGDLMLTIRRNSGGGQKSIEINRYGVVKAVN